MRFQPTIQAWKIEVYNSILDGSLRLQCGQWIQCNRGSKPSRFVGITQSGALWAIHPNHAGRVSLWRFQRLVDNYKYRLTIQGWSK